MSFGARPVGYSAPTAGASLPANLYVEDIKLGGTAFASFSLDSSGAYTSVGTTAPSGSWKTGSDASSNYEARMSISSGSFDSGTTGSWLSLGSTRTWSMTQSTSGSQFAQATLEIRNASTLTVLTTCNFQMYISRF